MNKLTKSTIIIVTAISVIGTSSRSMVAASPKSIKVSAKKVTIIMGKKKTVKVKNAKNFTVKSSKKSIVMAKKKGSKVILKAKKTGNAKVTIKAPGKKSTKIRVKVKTTSTTNRAQKSNKKYNEVQVSTEKRAAAQKAAAGIVKVKFSDSDKDMVDGDTVVLSQNDSIKYVSFRNEYVLNISDYQERIALAYYNEIGSYGPFGKVPKWLTDIYKSLPNVRKERHGKKLFMYLFDLHDEESGIYLEGIGTSL